MADRNRVIGDAVAVDIPGMRPNKNAVYDPVSGLAKWVIEIPGMRPNGDAVNGIVDIHVSTEVASGRAGNAFVISANGKTLKTREFDLKTAPDRAGLVLSSLEGSIEAKSFSIRPDNEVVRKLHPGLIGSPSVVLHHFGVDDRYAFWRSHLKTQISRLDSEGERRTSFAGVRSLPPSETRRRCSD